MWTQNHGWRISLFSKLFLKCETDTYFILKLHLPLLESDLFVIGNLTWTIAKLNESSSYESLVLFHRPMWMFLGSLVQFVCSLPPCASYLLMGFLKIWLYSHFFLYQKSFSLHHFYANPFILHSRFFILSISTLHCQNSDPLRVSVLFLENISPYFSGCINVSSLPLTSSL